MQARPHPLTLTRAVTRSDESLPRASEVAALFERLFLEYRTPILNYLYRLVGDAAQAEDLAQEAFTRAWRARGQLALVDNQRAWLYHIVTNAARDHLRRKRLIAWLPLLDPAQDLHGLWLAGWRSDGLQRLRSQHLALPGEPFASPDAPLGLGPAQRLNTLSPAASRLDEANPAHWLWGSVRVQHLVWAPDGRSFLAEVEIDPGLRQLWDVPLDGSAPRLAATGDIREYGWAPDGTSIVFIQFDPAAAALASDRPYAIQAVQLSGMGRAPVPLVTRLPTAQLPGLSAEGVWFFTGGNLWRVAYAGGAPQLVAVALAANQPEGEPRPAPDGGEIAFACGADPCFMPLAGGRVDSGTRPSRVTGLEPAEMTWSPDGTRLAVVDRSTNPGVPVQLSVVGRDGKLAFSSEIAPGDVTETSQWLPDNSAVLVQTYPYQGQRIIAVGVASQQVYDLSQEHWDAYFALAPDGTQLLLNNGRGDFWTAPLIRRR